MAGFLRPLNHHTMSHLLFASPKFRQFKLFLLALILMAGNTAFGQSWPAGIHDPSSIVKCGDKYWIFGTGDGIVSKYSTDMITWTDGPTPFTKTEWPQWILNYVKNSTSQFEGFFWAPDIIYMNERYYLYYSCSLWGTMSSCIGVVVNKTLDPASPDYKWEDQGDMGIYSWVANPLTNAIDPAVMKGPDGRVWMTYGSFNRDGIVVTQLDSITGKPKNTSRYPIANSWTGGSSYGEGEGGCMVYRNGYYYLFYNKGGCCAGVASTYYVVMGRSTSPTGPFIDKENKLLYRQNATSGGTVVFKHDDARGFDDRYYGPGHIGIYRENGTDYVTFHYYDPNGYYPNAAANYKGGPTLGLAKLKWGADGWPYISMDFLDRGYYKFSNAKTGLMLDLQNQSTNATTKMYVYPNNIWDTQKWLLTPLGTGEYTIRSYADTTKYAEATGTNFDAEVKVATSFNNAINQKFRLVTSPNGKTIIYPSTKDNILESSAFNISYPARLLANNNTEQQRWIASPFNETLSLSHSSKLIDNNGGTISDISLTSNGSWNVLVENTDWISVTPVSGNGNATLNIVVANNAFAEPRTNKITIRSKAGNTAVLAINQNNETPTSVTNIGIVDAMVAPNPTKGLITVSTNAQLPALIEVINHAGIVVSSIKTLLTQTTLDLHHLPNGIYLVKISDEKGSVVKKIMKQ
jgi:arabinan endo-1,5-alpha-L-arabinosidase